MFVIVGATGQTGSVVAETLLAQGKPVRVMARSADKAAGLQAKGAQVAIGSAEDVVALTAAFKGATGAYLMIPPDMQARDVLGRGERIIEAQAAAARAAGLSHVVLLSSVGAHRSHGTGVVKTLHHGEKVLAALPSAFTSIRAGYFFENWAGLLPVASDKGMLPTAISLGLKMPMVSTQDVGQVAAQALLESPPPGTRRYIELAGPVDVSPTDVAAVLSQLMGKTVAPVQITLDDMKKSLVGMGASVDTATQFAELIEGFNSGATTLDSQNATLARGKVTLEDALGAMLENRG